MLKHEIDLLPKDRRKEEFKHRKENLERDQKRRVRERERAKYNTKRCKNITSVILALELGPLKFSPHGSWHIHANPRISVHTGRG